MSHKIWLIQTKQFYIGYLQKRITKLYYRNRNYEIYEITNLLITKLRIYEFTKLRIYEITKLRIYEITNLRNYEFTKLLITKLLITKLLIYEIYEIFMDWYCLGYDQLKINENCVSET